jgi:hypothetical protein
MIYLKFCVDSLPNGFAGKTNAFVIRILKSHKDDRGLLEHEKVHVKQFWRCPLHGLFYRFSEDYRLKSEVEAYRVQYKYGADLDTLADHLSSKYDLMLTFEKAKELIKCLQSLEQI